MSNGELKLTRTLTQLKLRITQNIIEVNGVSMEPLIYEGDCVHIEKCNSYNIGDIVAVVDMNNRILLHRLIRIDKNENKSDSFITKGDNAVGIDESYRENCVGKAILIYEGALKPENAPQSNKINPYKPLFDRMIIALSKRMNRKFMAGIPSEKLFSGWERGLIKRIVWMFYRKRKHN